MKYLTLLSIFLFTYCMSIKAQTDTLLCDANADTNYLKTVPWYGNNSYLQNFLDSIGYPSATNRIVGNDRVKYRIPIKFWIYRSSGSTTGGPNLAQLQSYIDNLNRLYNVDNNTLIGFYMRCNVSYVNAISQGPVNFSFLEASLAAQSNKEKGCINIHIVDNLPGNTIGVQLRARFFGLDGIFLSRVTYQGLPVSSYVSSISHEVGHYLQLDHTHSFNTSPIWWREPISRTRTWSNGKKVCQTTGDLLEDTPADPELSTNFSCSYINVGKTDLWGDSYGVPPSGSSSPDPTNILSYNGLRTCCNHFSRQQIAVMLYSIERGKSKGNKTGWKDIRGEYDEYETDNDINTARLIQYGEVQERNFNQQYTSEDIAGNAIWTNCDIDWIKYTAPCSGPFFIETSAMPGRVNADTKVTLFNATGTTQLAQNDNISGTSLFSKLSYNFVSGTTYLIRVENMNPTVTGYYSILVGSVFSIAGPASFCNSANYVVQQSLPANSTVAWSVNPGNLIGVSGQPGAPQTTAFRLMNSTAGTAILKAIITPGACGPNPATALLPIAIINPSIEGYYSVAPSSGPTVNYPLTTGGSMGFATNTRLGFFLILTTPNLTNVTWSVSGSYLSYTSTANSLNLNMISPGNLNGVNTATVSLLSATGPCGFVTSNYNFQAVSTSQALMYTVKASPNPAKGTVNLTITKVLDTTATTNDATSRTSSASSKQTGYTSIGLYDINTNGMVKQWNYQEAEVASNYKLDIIAVKAGYYILKIERDGNTTSTKLFVQ